MKLLLQFLFLICLTQVLHSQAACKPDSLYRDSTVGVYPRPILPGSTSGGIDKPACINKPYEFVLTVKIPDTVSVQGFVITLNSAKIEPTGAVKNLPVGIDYMCNPPDCVFPKFSIGCIVLKGTATSANVPGLYKPVIKLTLNTAFGNFVVDFPGSQFPGEYILTLLDEKCNVGTNNPSQEKQMWYPNPNFGNFHTSSNQLEHIKIFNQYGKMVYSNDATQQVDVSQNKLSDGLYLIQWIEAGRSYVQKIWIMNP